MPTLNRRRFSGTIQFSAAEVFAARSLAKVSYQMRSSRIFPLIQVGPTFIQTSARGDRVNGEIFLRLISRLVEDVGVDAKIRQVDHGGHQRRSDVQPRARRVGDVDCCPAAEVAKRVRSHAPRAALPLPDARDRRTMRGRYV